MVLRHCVSPLWLCLFNHCPSALSFLFSLVIRRVAWKAMTHSLTQRRGIHEYGKQTQEDCHNSLAILGYIVRTCVQNKQTNKLKEENRKKKNG